MAKPEKFGSFKLCEGLRNSQRIWIVYRDGAIDPLAERQSREQAVRYIERQQLREVSR